MGKNPGKMSLAMCRQGNPPFFHQEIQSLRSTCIPSLTKTGSIFCVCLLRGLPSSFWLNFSVFLFLLHAGPGKQMSRTPWSASHSSSSLFPGSNCCSIQKDKKALKVMTLVLISHTAGPYPTKS